MTPLGSRPSYSNDRRTWMALTTWNVRKLHITADALVTEIVAEYVKPAVQSVSSVCDTWMATSPRTFFSFPKQTPSNVRWHLSFKRYEPPIHPTPDDLLPSQEPGLAAQRRQPEIMELRISPHRIPLLTHMRTRKFSNRNRNGDDGI